MGLTLRRQVTEPLARLATTTDRLAAGALDARLGQGAHGPDELGRVADGFDHMADRVQTMVGDLAEQHRFLQAIGCHELQGFLFSKAVPASEIDRLLRLDNPFAEILAAA